MSWFFYALGIILAIIVGTGLYLITARRYQSSNTVANSYANRR